MILELDLESPVPPYEQLRLQLATLIDTGALAPNTRLPPIRQLAADLGLATGTVARAYTELENGGLVRGNGRRGTVVTGRDGRPPKTNKSALLERAARTFAAEVTRLGIDPEGALRAVESQLRGRRTGTVGGSAEG